MYCVVFLEFHSLFQDFIFYKQSILNLPEQVAINPNGKHFTTILLSTKYAAVPDLLLLLVFIRLVGLINFFL